MTTTLVGRAICRLLAGSKIGHRERIHIADYLAVREMKACLAFTNKGRIRHHCEGGCSSRRELDVDHLCQRGQWTLEMTRMSRATYLVITDIIITFVDAFSIRAVVQCGCNVLDIGYAIYKGACRPFGISLGHGIQVYCEVD